MASVLAWVTGVYIITESLGCYLVVEKWQPASLQCTVPSNATRVTWEMMSGSTTLNLSTCNFVSNSCSDTNSPSGYQGSIINNGYMKTVNLSIERVKVNETQFLCTYNNGHWNEICKVQVYAWPTKPTCTQSVTSTYVDYICTTGNVYPSISATLHRRNVTISKRDLDKSRTGCTLRNLGSGTDGDYAAVCRFRVPVKNMIPESNMYVEMVPFKDNVSTVQRKSTFSDDIITRLNAASAPRSTITWLLPMTLILGALSTGIVSLFPSM